MTKLHTETDVLAALRATCAGRGGQARFSAAHLIPRSTVSEVHGGKRPMTESVANALGFVRTDAYRRIQGGNADG